MHKWTGIWTSYTKSGQRMIVRDNWGYTRFNKEKYWYVRIYKVLNG